jgi:orotidine-5'-phosphate decarboxylase
MKKGSDRLCVALDTDSLENALRLARRLSECAGHVKIGLELFSAAGPEAVSRLRELVPGIFLDLKLYDIPNTVSHAVRMAAKLGVSLLTVHASGGAAMIGAAREAAETAASSHSVQHPRILAVTVLTSIDDDALSRTFGVRMSVQETALHLAKTAKDAGADGVVCSAREVARIKKVCGSEFLTVTPGIRPASAAAGDQKRVTTPAEAIKAGSDLLVVGRPITVAPDPVAAAEEILSSIAGRLR